jgi:mannose-6-phosphate isomerase-like protein (cupin superfamily)
MTTRNKFSPEVRERAVRMVGGLGVTEPPALPARTLPFDGMPVPAKNSTERNRPRTTGSLRLFEPELQIRLHVNLPPKAITMQQSPIAKINLSQAFSRIDDHWNPRIAGAVNDAQVKLVKFTGAFDWHHHEHEDELFLVVAGTMRMGLRTGDIDVEAGEFIIVPHGLEHRPEALSNECHVMLLEPNTTLNTGNIVNDRTHWALKTLES